MLSGSNLTGIIQLILVKFQGQVLFTDHFLLLFSLKTCLEKKMCLNESAKTRSFEEIQKQIQKKTSI